MDSQEKIYIAIADDHTIFRAGLKQLINTFPEFNVPIDAANGQDLICQLEASDIPVSICILDITMPGLNGYDTLKAIKKGWPAMKTLILTMHGSEFPIIKLLRNGANGYLLKGANPEELYAALKEIHEKGFYSSELITSKFISAMQTIRDRHLSIDFTENELQFLKLCLSEMSYKEMAIQMGLSPRTVESYRDSLFDKLNLKSRTGLIIYALKTGLLSLE
jgi:two-component system, NarL family, invasion response regulator UvrY